MSSGARWRLAIATLAVAGIAITSYLSYTHATDGGRAFGHG